VATPSAQLDRSAIEWLALDVVQRLLIELGSGRAAAQVHPGAHLDRDLGIGSLERVELLLRLSSTFGVTLPDRVMAEADTLDDLVAAILRAPSVSAELTSANGAARLAHPAADAHPRRFSLEGFESLTEVLLVRGRAEPERPHIYLRETDSEERRITYGELLEGATAVGRGLLRRGLVRNETVAIMLPTGEAFFPTFFGVMLAGGIPVPIYPPFRADRIEEYASRQAAILRNAEARFLVTFRAAERLAKLLQPEVRSLRGVVDAARLPDPNPPNAPGDLLPSPGRGEDIAFLQYTSGSTGAPKGVIVTHANLLANLRAIGEGIEIRPDDVAVSWLPLYHDMGLIGAWFVPLCFGIPLVALSPLAFLSRPERWLWAIHHHRGTLTPAPNFAFELCVRKIAARDIEGLDLSSVRAALNGAEPVHPETLERFAERFAPYGLRPEALLPVYGLAEATLAVSATPLGSGQRVDRIDRATFEREGRAVPAAAGDPRALAFVSAGRPLSCFEIRIADAKGRDTGERVEGELWFRGPSATRGYYRNPEATQAILRGDGWIDSGDRAYIAGGEIYITGRTKDIIIKGGRNLYPHEVEEITGRVPGVRKGCVVAFGAPDPQTGTERLVVAAEIRNASEREPIEAQITQAVAETLGIPPDIVRLLPPQSVPKTSSGKLRRDETRQLYLTGKLGERLPPVWVQAVRLAARNGTSRALGTARKLARTALERTYGLYALVAFGLWLVPASLIVGILPSRRAAARFIRPACRTFFALIGCPLRIEGREHLEKVVRASRERKASWVLAANHTSYLDVMALLATLPIDYRFSAKIEVRSWPLVGIIVRKLGQLTFDRSDPRGRLQQAAEIEQTLLQGESVVVFPEGTFTPFVGVRPFQLGAFKAAAMTRRAVCPVALRGTRRILRDETYLPRPGRVTLTFCPPLEPAGDDWREVVRLRDATRVAIGQHCGEPLL
jgi:1-acyl-sn-glycerol-3-phosphate acyltransferase